MKQECPNCGTINPKLNAFCVNCGNNLRTAGVSSTTGPFVTSQPTPGLTVTSKTNRGLIFTLAGILAALMIGLTAIILIAVSGTKPSSVTNPIAAAEIASPVVSPRQTTMAIGQSSTSQSKSESPSVTIPTQGATTVSNSEQIPDIKIQLTPGSDLTQPLIVDGHTFTDDQLVTGTVVDGKLYQWANRRARTVNVQSLATSSVSASSIPTTSPTFTPVPTETPQPTYTPQPTNTTTPVPTLTPVPTATPIPISNANKIAFCQPDDNNHWNVYTINFDGTGLNTLIHRDQDVISPAFSPDGQRIVYVLDYEKNRRQLRMVNADGSGDRALTDDNSKNEYPFWVDNQNILFVSYRNYPAGSGNSDILQLNVTNGNESMVVQLGGYPSKVGDLTTFTRFTGKYQQIYGMDSSGTRVLEGFNSDFDFGMVSPDGQRIVASQNYSKLYLLDRNGNKEQLTPDGEIAKDPVWSPDGRYVAYLLKGVNNNIWEVNVIDVNTRQTRRLFTNGKLKSYLAWGR